MPEILGTMTVKEAAEYIPEPCQKVHLRSISALQTHSRKGFWNSAG